ncbi:uncharacterized protein LOC114964272 [Acropora millepora]|uniref:uncharacterized protein LOC114964272 n=1 Tax=Acropora millepora TaxID=45264 RepID=UPI001CF430FA|nr:uncharacterized protein LOC114964272 [Acropora millepora]
MAGVAGSNRFPANVPDTPPSSPEDAETSTWIETIGNLETDVILATMIPNRSWQTLLNFLNIGRSRVSFFFFFIYWRFIILLLLIMIIIILRR